MIRLIFILIWAAPIVGFSQGIKPRQARKIVDAQEILKEHFVGFMLQNSKGESIFEQHADHYFIPASNTKMLTLYASLKVLGDSIPAFDYIMRGDSLVIWGTGDPSFLHPKLDNGRVFQFLSTTPYTIYLAQQEEPDFEPSYWRADLAAFPIYGNTASFEAGQNGQLKITPAILEKFVMEDPTLSIQDFDVLRNQLSNGLVYPSLPIPNDFSEQVPFPTNHVVSQLLLSDTLRRPVQLIEKKRPVNYHTFYSIPSDSLYKHMMQPSDNFLAEQQLLLVSSRIGERLQVKDAISYTLERDLNHLQHPPQWYDGSGLSRLNLFTPKTVMEVLRLLENELGMDRVKVIFPAGGVSGTLKNAYQTDDLGRPFVWAKTGTLRYTHLQSGWLRSRKGNEYRFVFMNNNFVKPTSEIRQAMVSVMTQIWENY